MIEQILEEQDPRKPAALADHIMHLCYAIRALADGDNDIAKEQVASTIARLETRWSDQMVLDVIKSGNRWNENPPTPENMREARRRLHNEIVKLDAAIAAAEQEKGEPSDE